MTFVFSLFFRSVSDLLFSAFAYSGFAGGFEFDGDAFEGFNGDGFDADGEDVLVTDEGLEGNGFEAFVYGGVAVDGKEERLTACCSKTKLYT